MKITPPLRVYQNVNDIVAILDDKGRVVTEIYAGQYFDFERMAAVAPTVADNMSIAEAFVAAYNALKPT